MTTATTQTFASVTLYFTERQIASLLCGALEGGSNYWIYDNHIHLGDDDGRPFGDEYTPTYLRAPFSRNGYVEIDPGDGEPKVKLDKVALKRGLQVMAELKEGEGGHHFGDWLKGADDATTADVYLQCCLFGKIVFG